ncbi:hypothetical protein [Methanocella sp. MCL-LM]|uniref:hypothetical protein n=1 Tax=Methanocella sp. MCL-LM TaxID=3412035 RepID=UPI003C70CF0F
MPGKFKKRDVERKGTEKQQERDMKFLDENAEDLADPDKLREDFDKETSPPEERVTSGLRKREGV